jgi:hypothetical protein
LRNILSAAITVEVDLVNWGVDLLSLAILRPVLYKSIPVPPGPVCIMVDKSLVCREGTIGRWRR